MNEPADTKAAASAKRATPRGGPLDGLCAIDRLTVGPVRVEARRIVAPYVVEQAGAADATELMYRFEEDVLDRRQSADVNLASMMAAQVALNYGLFCREIVFRGTYDNVDQRFLRDMAENTAREIYVKKFLEPNPFLVGEAAKLSAVQLPSYCAAQLRFEGDPGEQGGGDAGRGWGAASIGGPGPRHLVLSSGGKDSLLSFGLLDEIGAEVHSVFINESGRHWFTALNAYRHFAVHVPNTARVWTNADRLFSWMLRRLPFVRQDFAEVRADEYPIRLWTVAVFLFGALPIARRRGAGRIIIGDEFDTTERTSHQGITHYNGLYDQSRYFDDALSRYYAAKSWPACQFSLLRQCSEMLIEKVLAERYPQLLRLQTSCHATHKQAERVSPCGRCEKCRRIVGMLCAVGSDPALCGYGPGQVKQCLLDLQRLGVHQERDGAEHLGYLLSSRALIDGGAIGTVKAKQQRHIMQLRFDRERSPVGGMPVDLRTRLYPLLLEHTDRSSGSGAVRRQGRLWTAFDPLSAASLARPYPFDRTAVPSESGKSNNASAKHGFVLGELTWPEAEARLKQVDIALLPVGAIEQHGPHLPLDTDAFDARYLAMQVAQACAEPRPFVLPLIPYGVSYHHDDFRGTISVTNETLSRLVYEIGMSVARNGITKLVVINGHGGNAATLHFAAQMINRDAHIFTCVDTGETSDTDIERIAETPGDIHAGEIETSTALATRPELVNMTKAKRSVPKFSSRYLDFSSKRSVDWYARTMKISRSGVMGDPSKASREKGERIWEVMIKNLVELVEHLKCMSLDEIHQRNRF